MAWKITAPFLSDEDRAQVVTPGGLAGQPVDTSKLLGPVTGERVFAPDPAVRAINQQPHLYGNTVDRGVVSERRERNKQARKARRANRKAGKR